MRFSRNVIGVSLIGLGIIAIGWFIWNIGVTYLGLVSFSSTQAVVQNTNSTTKETVFTLPEIRFWTCQVGVFSKEANAKGEEQRLNNLGLQASTFSSDPWAVGVGFATEKDQLKELQEKLTFEGINSYLKELTIPEQSYRIGGNRSDIIIKALGGINLILKLDYKSEKWDETSYLTNLTFKDEVPRELYTLRDEFKNLLTTEKDLILEKKLSLAMKYRETLDLLARN